MTASNPSTAVVDAGTLKAYKQQFNFYATPPEVAARMAQLIDDVGLGARILEPSAGLGGLIQVIKQAIVYPISPIEFCEVQPEFAPILVRLGAVPAGTDFLEYHPGPVYDAVVMNPPYRNRQAIKHVAHAWNCTKPGGRIVSLVDPKTGDWIMDEFQGHVFDRQVLPKGTFVETPIETHIYLIVKPLY